MGTGEDKYVQALQELERQYKGRVVAYIGYDKVLCVGGCGWGVGRHGWVGERAREGGRGAY